MSLHRSPEELTNVITHGIASRHVFVLAGSVCHGVAVASII